VEGWLDGRGGSGVLGFLGCGAASVLRCWSGGEGCEG